MSSNLAAVANPKANKFPEVRTIFRCLASYKGGANQFGYETGRLYSVSIQGSSFCVGVWREDQGKANYLGYRNVDEFAKNWSLDFQKFENEMPKDYEARLFKMSLIDKLKSTR